MDIKIKNNKIQVADISAFTNRTIYSVPKSRDSITFIFNDSVKQTIIVDETTVNGTQMTSDNIDQLLSPLFIAPSCGSGISTQNDVYTKVEYSDPLVFPTPIRSGHVVEFYKDSELYQSYQWNGWIWIIIGAEPNLIFTHYGGNMLNILNSNDIIFNTKNNGKNILSMKENGNYSDAYIYAKSIDLISKDYKIGNLSVFQDINIPNLKIASFSTYYLTISQSQTNPDFISDNVEITDCETESFSINVLSEKCLIKNITTVVREGFLHYNNVNITATDLTLDNTGCSNINIYCLQKDQNTIPTSTINIINNNGLTDGGNNNASLFISGNRDGFTSVNADLNLTNNIGIGSVNIVYFNNNSIINSFSGNFDKYLSYFYINDCKFTEQALDDLINSLAVIPKQDGAKRNIQISKVTPALTEIQKTALTNAGWTIK